MKKQILITAGALLGLTLVVGPQVSYDLSPISSAQAQGGGGGGAGGGGSAGLGARGMSADAPGRAVSAVARDKSTDDGTHGATVSAVAQGVAGKATQESGASTVGSEATGSAEPQQ